VIKCPIVLCSVPLWLVHVHSAFALNILHNILSDERMGLSFTIAAGPSQPVHSRVLPQIRDFFVAFYNSNSRTGGGNQRETTISNSSCITCFILCSSFAAKYVSLSLLSRIYKFSFPTHGNVLRNQLVSKNQSLSGKPFARYSETLSSNWPLRHSTTYPIAGSFEICDFREMWRQNATGIWILAVY
jgi:hypothetical protein